MCHRSQKRGGGGGRATGTSRSLRWYISPFIKSRVGRPGKPGRLVRKAPDFRPADGGETALHQRDLLLAASLRHLWPAHRSSISGLFVGIRVYPPCSGGPNSRVRTPDSAGTVSKPGQTRFSLGSGFSVSGFGKKCGFRHTSSLFAAVGYVSDTGAGLLTFASYFCHLVVAILFF